MSSISTFLHWFSGGADQYHTLWHCMRGDTLWVAITIGLDLAVASGYIVIAYHWFKNERNLPPSPPRQAMATIRNIFIFCGLCGYLFIPIKVFWPAWRLYDVFVAILAFYTWRYAFSAMDLKVVYNELGRSQKLAAELADSQATVKRRSDFLNAISHDLRTPLNGLTLRANLAEMQHSCGDGTGLERSLAEIRASARGVAEMLDQLLEYARVERDAAPASADRFPLADLAEEVIHDTAALAAGNENVVVSNIPSDLIVRTDRARAKRILGNLVNNAVKFTTRGNVRMEAEWSGANLEIHVIDTGIGVPPEQQEAIFEEFYQVNNDQRDRARGFGLGLPIARQLARKLGGDLHLHSTPGRGSRFTLILPGAIPQPHSRGTPTASPSAPPDALVAKVTLT